jgi:hypothetical protein
MKGLGIIFSGKGDDLFTRDLVVAESCPRADLDIFKILHRMTLDVKR